MISHFPFDFTGMSDHPGAFFRLVILKNDNSNEYVF